MGGDEHGPEQVLAPHCDTCRLPTCIRDCGANHRCATAVPVVLVPPGGYRPSGGLYSFKSLPAAGVCQEKGHRDDAAKGVGFRSDTEPLAAIEECLNSPRPQ